MPRPFDLRSDTVTQPTAAMRDAMACAVVGDDCYADDPSVASLEQEVASLLGKEAALWLPSGTMANQLAIHLWVRPGGAVAVSPGSHVQAHEDGSASRLSGAQLMPIGETAGYTARELSALLDEEAHGWPPVALAWVENTLGLAGGLLWPLESMAAIGEEARGRGKHVHLDGARLWNAIAASGIEATRWASHADSVSVCMSKGLGAPAGSLLTGGREFIERARATRHAFGGGMRQVGVLAAAGTWALANHRARLVEDHRRASELSEGLRGLGCWTAREPETNIALFDVEAPHDASDLCAQLRAAGVLCYPNRRQQIRLVTHLGIDDDDLAQIVAIVCETLGPTS